MTLRASVPQPLKAAGRAVSIRVGSATAGGRQLPSFVLVGAQRAGTTSLFRARIFAMEEELSRILGRKADLQTPGFLNPRYRSRVQGEAEVAYGAA